MSLCAMLLNLFIVLCVMTNNTMNELSSMAHRDMRMLFCALFLAPTLIVPR